MRMNTYVDDPVSIVKGTQKQRTHLATVLMLIFSSLGFPLAFRKAQWSEQVTWIGVTLRFALPKFVVTISEERISELAELTSDGLS